MGNVRTPGVGGRMQTHRQELSKKDCPPEGLQIAVQGGAGDPGEAEKSTKHLYFK